MTRESARRPLVVLGLLGTSLDARGRGPRRWNAWRPTVGLCSQEDLQVDRLELLHGRSHRSLAATVAADVTVMSPETEVRLHELEVADPWDFEGVFAALLDFARVYPFATDDEEYLVHITTGTHVAQICLFLLAESRHLPARLVQTSPRGGEGVAGGHAVIDLDLSRYDAISSRFAVERAEGTAGLKGGIETRNDAYNRLIDRIETVAVRSRAPLLLTGPTGAGKSLLARRVHALKVARRQIDGPVVEVNCATLRGSTAMSALFGHTRGAFTGATHARPGLLRTADGGLLFLDEIGELGTDEQAMLLRALEIGRFLPVGADKEVSSDFQLIAGTNRDLSAAVRAGRFREDLLARIDHWSFELPALRDRPEDVAPNVEYELERIARETGQRLRFSREARDRFLRFATAPDTPWTRNFRDLVAAMSRMATLAPGGRITGEVVDEEIGRLRTAWRRGEADEGAARVERCLGSDATAALDRFDRVQLADVLAVCERTPTLAAAGRELFARSRQRRRTVNDADRLRKYLEKHGIDRAAIEEGRTYRSSTTPSS